MEALVAHGGGGWRNDADAVGLGDGVHVVLGRGAGVVVDVDGLESGAAVERRCQQVRRLLLEVASSGARRGRGAHGDLAAGGVGVRALDALGDVAGARGLGVGEEIAAGVGENSEGAERMVGGQGLEARVTGVISHLLFKVTL